jgi:RHS repeat-associated protein
VTNGVTTTYTYDNNGNTLTKTVGTAKTTYQWNVENRLVGADIDGDGINDVTYEYDGDGIRIRQTVAGEETRFLVDKNRDYAQVLEEYTPSKIIKASYIYGNDLISQLRNTERSFYHVDGLGSTRALTDINGLLTDAYAYEAFGEIIKQLGNTQNSYLFAGEQRDPNLGLDYLRARYLDVSTGRFVSRDSFSGFYKEPLTLHKYLYANANPSNLTDPSGLFSFGGFFAPIVAWLGATTSLVLGTVTSISMIGTRLLQSGVFNTQNVPLMVQRFAIPAANTGKVIQEFIKQSPRAVSRWHNGAKGAQAHFFNRVMEDPKRFTEIARRLDEPPFKYSARGFERFTQLADEIAAGTTRFGDTFTRSGLTFVRTGLVNGTASKVGHLDEGVLVVMKNNQITSFREVLGQTFKTQR